jgi:hypothetical protein
MNSPDPLGSISGDTEFTNKIHKAISQGVSVIVKGWRPGVLREFSMEAFELAGFSGDQTIVCHGKFHFSLPTNLTCLHRCQNSY